MVPFIKACIAAGHDALVAVPAGFEESVTKHGFPVATFGTPDPNDLGRIFASLPELPREEANTRVVRDIFAGFNTTAALPGVEAIVDDFRPDVVIRDPAEFAS